MVQTYLNNIIKNGYSMSINQYFKSIDLALKQQGAMQPTLVIDKTRLDENISHLRQVIDQGYDYRIVAKSLPSIPLLQYLMERTGSNRLMSFHLPFLKHLTIQAPNADVLLGKPMPVLACKEFYDWFAQQQTSFKADKQLHWLIDSTERLQQYQTLCEENNLQINVSLEIDIGLHRGGYSDLATFETSLELIKDSKHITLTGLMGYEAHASKIPKLVGGSKKAFTVAMNTYGEFTQAIAKHFDQSIFDKLMLNAGGSSTYPLYDLSGTQHQLSIDTDVIKNTKINEIATASALVKPTDFDTFTLEHHKPACFIATPVLKKVVNPDLPMASGLSKILRSVGLMTKHACFIYGGNWLAQPFFPTDSKRSNIFGHSSNQEMYELKNENDIQVDDFFYFRPTQSETVFLQFGKIAVYENGKITDWWSVFSPEELHQSKTNHNKNNNDTGLKHYG